MSSAGGPQLITDSLVLCLDAANAKSYPGSGTTWRDLRNYGNYTLNAGYTYSTANNGYIAFDGNNGSWSSDSNTARTVFANNSFSLLTFVYPRVFTSLDAASFARVFEKAGYPNSYYLMSIIASTGKVGFEGYDTSATPKSFSFQTTTSLTANNWYMLSSVVNRTTNTANVYINNTLSSVLNLPAGFSGLSPAGGFYIPSTYAEINAQYGNFLIYNKALSNTEIQQTYNAFKGRYNLS